MKHEGLEFSISAEEDYPSESSKTDQNKRQHTFSCVDARLPCENASVQISSRSLSCSSPFVGCHDDQQYHTKGYEISVPKSVQNFYRILKYIAPHTIALSSELPVPHVSRSLYSGPYPMLPVVGQKSQFGDQTVH